MSKKQPTDRKTSSMREYDRKHSSKAAVSDGRNHASTFDRQRFKTKENNGKTTKENNGKTKENNGKTAKENGGIDRRSSGRSSTGEHKRSTSSESRRRKNNNLELLNSNSSSERKSSHRRQLSGDYDRNKRLLSSSKYVDKDLIEEEPCGAKITFKSTTGERYEDNGVPVVKNDVDYYSSLNTKNVDYYSSLNTFDDDVFSDDSDVFCGLPESLRNEIIEMSPDLSSESSPFCANYFNSDSNLGTLRGISDLQSLAKLQEYSLLSSITSEAVPKLPVDGNYPKFQNPKAVPKSQNFTKPTAKTAHCLTSYQTGPEGSLLRYSFFSPLW